MSGTSADASGTDAPNFNSSIPGALRNLQKTAAFRSSFRRQDGENYAISAINPDVPAAYEKGVSDYGYEAPLTNFALAQSELGQRSHFDFDGANSLLRSAEFNFSDTPNDANGRAPLGRMLSNILNMGFCEEISQLIAATYRIGGLQNVSLFP